MTELISPCYSLIKKKKKKDVYLLTYLRRKTLCDALLQEYNQH